MKGTAATRHGINPATLKDLPDVPVSTQADLDSAVSSAKAAFKSWSKTSIEERRKCLCAFADAFEKEREGFAKLLVQEQGKPLGTANIEISMTLQWIREMPKQEISDEVIEDTEQRKIVHRWVPIGVCGGLVPWNWVSEPCRDQSFLRIMNALSSALRFPVIQGVSFSVSVRRSEVCPFAI